jgi:hypothetical protein
MNLNSLVNLVWHDYTILLQFIDIIQQLLIVAILQMMHTHARASASQGGNDDDLPPPPPPTAIEFMAQFLGSQRAMEEVLRNIMQNTAHGCNRHQGLEPNQYSDFKDLLDTKPPIFNEAEEPL